MNSLFGYDPQDTWLHRLTGATKMLAFIGISVIVMASYFILTSKNSLAPN